MKPDLVEGGPEDIRNFVVAVVTLATMDYIKGYKEARTGIEIARMLTSQHRLFHRPMATGIYNKTLRTLKMMERWIDYDPERKP